MAALAHVVWSPALLDYDFGAGHPMAPTRLQLTIRLARDLGLLSLPGVEVVDVLPAPDDVLTAVHEAAYVAAVHEASDHGRADRHRGLGTEDDPVFAGMHDAAARIAAGSRDAALTVWRGEAAHGVNIAGGMHHAMPGAAAGFCIYNDAAVAIQALLDEGAERVAYVDLDAHHGDGVERAFWDDPRVLTVSVHQSPATLFPGTGYPTDTGGAPGSAVNLALPPRTGSAAWLRAVDAVVPEALRAFAPQILVTQHGCDAHGTDPLSDLRVGVAAQRVAAGWLHDLAHELCEGRWTALGGGGYSVIDVVPLVWANLLAIAAHADLPVDTPVPVAWREMVERDFAMRAPTTMDGGDDAVAFARWTAGYDPADDVDRAVQATRAAAFPHLGVHIE
jgi:acetoin utilization protein AcuC